MLATVCTILALSSLVAGQIHVALVASADDGGPTGVEVSGSKQHLMTDRERLWFGLTDPAVKDVFNNIQGCTPDDVYWKSPTPACGTDVYEQFQRSQTLATYRALEGEVMEIETRPVIIAQQVYRNQFPNKKIKVTASMSQSVSNSVSVTFKGETELSTTVSFGVNLKIFESSATVSTSSKWGKDDMSSNTTTLTVTHGTELELEALEGATVAMEASQGTMRARVFLEAAPSGEGVFNFVNQCKGHHFYWLHAREICSVGRLDCAKAAAAYIDVGFMTGATLAVRPL